MNFNSDSFSEEEVQFQIDDIILTGTLSIPQKVGKTPAVILLSGYGPCPRDYEERGLKKFHIISSYLASNGIAVLRYDDRGAGNSSPVDWHQYTFYDLADEVLTALRFLQTHKDIDSSRIGLLGHSLGAAIAPIVAFQSEEIAFIILLGGHGLIGSKTGKITRKSLGQLIGETEEEAEEGANFVQSIYRNLLSENKWEEIQSVILEKMTLKFNRLSEDKQTMYKTVENYLNSSYEGFLFAYGNSPMFRSFLQYDPRSSLSKTSCPVLLLFGEIDVLHPPDHHKDAMLNALKTGGNNDITVEVFSQTDHEFTTVDSRKKKEFIPTLLPIILDWIERTYIE
jgi:pimeloyl-ACP methyl ester carboxylesterase